MSDHQYDVRNHLGAQARVDRPMSRVDNDVERLKEMTNRVRNTNARILRHTQSLGYFNPPSNGAATSAPTPVISNLSDALTDHDRALDELSATLNLFD